MNALSLQLKSLILIIQFLTRIPLPNQNDVTEVHFREGLKYFPVAGATIGIVLMAVNGIMVRLFNGDEAIIPVLLVITGVIMTGGLHLDGVADTFDGLYSNRSKERILEIMKDSRIGSNGVLALVGVLGLKVAGLASLDGIDPMILLLMPVFARFNVLVLCFRAISARPGGMGELFIGKVSIKDLVVGVVVVLSLSWLRPAYLVVLPFMMAFTLFFRRQVGVKISGITGDIIGATIEMNEVMFLIGVLVLTNI